MFSKTIIFALCALIAQSVLASTCTREYTIVVGDYCDKISAKTNTSTYQLAVNNIKTINADCTNLMPNNKLCLGTKGEDCRTTHVVSDGDTCDSISSAAGINNTMLTMNNPQINSECSNIYTGEVLCTASSAIVPHPPAGTKSPPISSPSPSPSHTDDIPFCDEL